MAKISIYGYKVPATKEGAIAPIEKQVREEVRKSCSQYSKFRATEGSKLTKTEVKKLRIEVAARYVDAIVAAGSIEAVDCFNICFTVGADIEAARTARLQENELLRREARFASRKKATAKNEEAVKKILDKKKGIQNIAFVNFKSYIADARVALADAKKEQKAAASKMEAVAKELKSKFAYNVGEAYNKQKLEGKEGHNLLASYNDAKWEEYYAHRIVNAWAEYVDALSIRAKKDAVKIRRASSALESSKNYFKSRKALKEKRAAKMAARKEAMKKAKVRAEKDACTVAQLNVLLDAVEDASNAVDFADESIAKGIIKDAKSAIEEASARAVAKETKISDYTTVIRVMKIAHTHYRVDELYKTARNKIKAAVKAKSKTLRDDLRAELESLKAEIEAEINKRCFNATVNEARVEQAAMSEVKVSISSPIVPDEFRREEIKSTLNGEYRALAKMFANINSGFVNGAFDTLCNEVEAMAGKVVEAKKSSAEYQEEVKAYNDEVKTYNAKMAEYHKAINSLEAYFDVEWVLEKVDGVFVSVPKQSSERTELPEKPEAPTPVAVPTVEEADIDLRKLSYFHFEEHAKKLGDSYQDKLLSQHLVANNPMYNELFQKFVIYVELGFFANTFEYNAGYSNKLIDAVNTRINELENKETYVDDFTRLVSKRLLFRKASIKNPDSFYISSIVINDMSGNSMFEEIKQDNCEYKITTLRNNGSCLARGNNLRFFKDGDMVIDGISKASHCKDLLQVTLGEGGYNLFTDTFVKHINKEASNLEAELDRALKLSPFYKLTMAKIEGVIYYWFGDFKKGGQKPYLYTEKGLVRQDSEEWDNFDIALADWELTYHLGAASPSGQRQAKLLYFLVGEDNLDDATLNMNEVDGAARWNGIFNEKTNNGLHLGDGTKVNMKKFIKKTVRALAPYAPSKAVRPVRSFALFNGENGLTDGAAYLSHLFSDLIPLGQGAQGRVLNTKCFYITEEMEKKVRAFEEAGYVIKLVDVAGTDGKLSGIIPEETDGIIYIVYDSSKASMYKEYITVNGVDVPMPDILTDRNGMKLLPDADKLGKPETMFNLLDMPKPSDFEDGSNTSLTIFTQLAYACGKNRGVNIAQRVTQLAAIEKMAAKLSTELGNINPKDPNAWIDLRSKTPNIAFCYNSLYKQLIENMQQEVVNTVRKMHFPISGAYCRATADPMLAWFSQKGIDNISVDNKENFHPVALIEDKLIYENEAYIPSLAEKFANMSKKYRCVRRRMALAFKYPTMGLRENFLFHALSLEEMKERIDMIENDILREYAKSFYENLGDCIMVMPACTERMDMLAGMDYDYDGLTVVTNPEIVEEFYKFACKNNGKEVMIHIDKNGIGEGERDFSNIEVPNDFTSFTYVTAIYAMANAKSRISEKKTPRCIEDFISAEAKSIGQITNYNVTNNIWLIEALSVMKKDTMSKLIYLDNAIYHIKGAGKKPSPLYSAHDFACKNGKLQLEFEKAEHETISVGLVPYYGIGTPVDEDGNKIDDIRDFDGDVFYELLIEKREVKMIDDVKMFRKMATCAWTLEEAKKFASNKSDAELVDIVMNNFINMLEELNDWYRGYQETQIDSAKTGIQKAVVCIFTSNTAKCCGVRSNEKSAEAQLDDFFYNASEKIVSKVEKTCKALVAPREGFNKHTATGLHGMTHEVNSFCRGFNVSKYFERIAMLERLVGENFNNLQYMSEEHVCRIYDIAKCYGKVAATYSKDIEVLTKMQLNGADVEDEMKARREEFTDDMKVLRASLMRLSIDVEDYVALNGGDVITRDIAAEIGLVCEFASNFSYDPSRGDAVMEKQNTTKFFWNVAPEFYLISNSKYFERTFATVDIDTYNVTEEVISQNVFLNGSDIINEYGEVVGVLPKDINGNTLSVGRSCDTDETYTMVSYSDRAELIVNSEVVATMLLEGAEVVNTNEDFVSIRAGVRTFRKDKFLTVGDVLVVNDEGDICVIDNEGNEKYSKLRDIEVALEEGTYMVTAIWSADTSNIVIRYMAK